MNTTVALTALLAIAFAAIGSAKLLAVASMRARAEHVGLGIDAYRAIGTLEVAGAVGLVAGFAVPLLRTLAALGLLLLMAGAVVAHLRVRTGSRRWLLPLSLEALPPPSSSSAPDGSWVPPPHPTVGVR